MITKVNVLLMVLVLCWTAKDFANEDDGMSQAEKQISSLIDVGDLCAAEIAVSQMKIEFEQNPNLNVVLSRILYKIACKYEEQGILEQAKALFTQIATDYPNTDRARLSTMQIEMHSINDMIDREDITNVETAIVQMTQKFAADPNSLSSFLNRIAWHCFENNDYTMCANIYRNNKCAFPDSPDYYHTLRGLAFVSIYLGDDQAVKDVIGEFIRKYSDHKYLTDAISRIAKEYRWIHEYEKALYVYQQVIDNWPADKPAFIPFWALAHIKIFQGNFDVAENIIDNLISNRSLDNTTAISLFRLGSDYHYMGQNDLARKVYQFVIQEWPDDSWRVSALITNELLNPELILQRE